VKELGFNISIIQEDWAQRGGWEEEHKYFIVDRLDMVEQRTLS
jgi:hypothetical protein